MPPKLHRWRPHCIQPTTLLPGDWRPNTGIGPLNATYDPCTECIKDLKAFIQDLQSKHHGIIFFIDVNETECKSKYQDGNIHKNSILDLFQTCQLSNPFQECMGTLPPSMTCNPDQAIDHVGTWKVDISTITKLAQHCPKFLTTWLFLLTLIYSNISTWKCHLSKLLRSGN